MENNNPTSPPAAPAAPIPASPAAPAYPVPAPDYGNELLAELRALRGETQASRAEQQAIRAAIEGMPAHVAEQIEAVFTAADEMEDQPASELAMETPASVSDQVREVVSERDSSADDDLTDQERKYVARGAAPPKRKGESVDDYRERLRRLPPLGMKGRPFTEAIETYRARRHDGAAKP